MAERNGSPRERSSETRVGVHADIALLMLFFTAVALWHLMTSIASHTPHLFQLNSAYSVAIASVSAVHQIN